MTRMGKIAAILVHTLFITMFLSVASPTRAQQVPPPPPQDVPKNKTFTLSGTFTIAEIFDQLHRQTDIYINRNHNIIDIVGVCFFLYVLEVIEISCERDVSTSMQKIVEKTSYFLAKTAGAVDCDSAHVIWFRCTS